MTLLAIERSLLQRARYSALSMGKKTPSQRQAMRPIVNLPEEDRATVIGNKQKKLVQIARVVPEISCRTDRQTDAIITIFRNRSRGQSNNTEQHEFSRSDS